ncbi:MAG: hypothetical protein WKF72_13065 [Nocardioidaceae bacterium]
MRHDSIAATVVAVMVGSALLVATPGASSAAPTRSSAYGIAVNAGGQEVVPPSPSVESTDGSTQSTGGEIPPEAGPLLSGGVLELSAGDDEARVSVTNLTIGNLAASLPPELREQLDQLQAACAGLEQAPVEELPDILGELPVVVEQPTEEELIEFCNGLLDGDFANLATIDTLQVACTGDIGTVTVLGASALGSGAPLDLENVEPNTELFPDNPLLSVTLNRQSNGPRGGFTVDGLVVSLGEGEAEAVVASTTCGEGIPQAAGDSEEPTEPPIAPAPTPQVGSAPVTG